MVISSEHFYDLMSDRATAEAFRDAARPHFTPVIVLFLRRQDYWQHSLYAQDVKTCYAAPISRFGADRDFYYDYNAGLLQLEDVFGRENVRVAIYRDGEAQDVIGDFLATVDALDLSDGSARSNGRTRPCTAASSCSWPGCPSPTRSPD